MRLTLWQRLTRPFRKKRPIRVEWVAAELLARGYNLEDIRVNGYWPVAYEEEERAVVEAVLRRRGYGGHVLTRHDL